MQVPKSLKNCFFVKIFFCVSQFFLLKVNNIINGAQLTNKNEKAQNESAKQNKKWEFHVHQFQYNKISLLKTSMRFCAFQSPVERCISNPLLDQSCTYESQQNRIDSFKVFRFLGQYERGHICSRTLRQLMHPF